MNIIEIKPEQLATSANKFRKELLMMPIIALERTTAHMTVRMGIQGKETVGELSGVAELGPYDADRESDGKNKINGRELETFLGSIIEKFDPNDVLGSIYGSMINSGKELTETEIVRQIVALKMAQISKNLNKSIFGAKRDKAGTKTMDLFNGFDTIALEEITAGNLAEDKGNLLKIATAIDHSNAVDALKSIYQAASDELQDEAHIKMFLPRDIYNAYNEDYKMTTGAIPYNTEFKKTFLEGSDNSCELVPLSSKKGSKLIQLTMRENMLVGCDQMGNKEKINVDRFDAFKVTLSAAMFFGAQYESISPEKMLIAQLTV